MGAVKRVVAGTMRVRCSRCGVVLHSGRNGVRCSGCGVANGSGHRVVWRFVVGKIPLGHERPKTVVLMFEHTHRHASQIIHLD